MDQDLLYQMNACFRDMHVFNSIVLTALIGRMDREGTLSKHEATKWLKSVANQCEEMEPNQQVSAMLRDLAETLGSPEHHPRWTPRIIE